MAGGNVGRDRRGRRGGGIPVREGEAKGGGVKVGLFPGQGIPAGKVLEALAEFPSEVEVASKTLGYDLHRRVEVAARGRGTVLPTSVAQPAIFLCGVLGFEKRQSGAEFEYLAGHSLGEYTALVAAGAMSFDDGLQAVAARGEAMEAAARINPGGMAAVMGLPSDEVRELAQSCRVAIANDNAPDQVVLSGSEEGLAKTAKVVRDKGGRAVLLEVSGAFHTDAMAPAEKTLADALQDIEIRMPQIPVVSNVTARPYQGVSEIRTLLVKQLVCPVRFRESLLWLYDKGVRDFVDVGPGSVVAGLAQRTFRFAAGAEGKGAGEKGVSARA